jgi:hypothetical protein
VINDVLKSATRVDAIEYMAIAYVSPVCLGHYVIDHVRPSRGAQTVQNNAAVAKSTLMAAMQG